MDPDIGLTEEEIEEQRRKIADPRRIYTRSDEQYPDARFRPSYVDPSMEKPVYQGMKTGGAEESEISPIDFVSEVPTLAKGAAKGFPALMAMIKKKGPNLPDDMSLLDRIKLAAKRSNVKAPEMEAAQAEREALRNQPKNFFDNVREKSSKEIFEENEKKLAEEAAAREASRIDRAKEMGFDPSKTWYHGSASPDIQNFDTYGSNYGLFGQGSYFTDNPEIASSYTSKGIKRLLREGKTPAPTVYPVNLKTKNPIVMEEISNIPEWKKAAGPDFAHIFENISENSKLTNEQVYRLIEDELASQGVPVVEGAEWVQNILRNKGHDSVKHIGGGRVGNGPKHNVTIVLDPNQIRSIFAKFDPAMKESGDILAGLAGAGLSFNQIKELLNKKSTDKDEL